MDLDSVMRAVAARTHLRPSPLILEYELTHLCNLACTYCDRHTPAPDELSLPEILTALTQFKELGMRVIGLDGGEPLAHPHFAAIVAWLAEHGVAMHLNSNGILVPKHLASVRKVELLKISLDGPGPCHDAMRGARAFERAVRGVRAAREAGIAVELRCVVGSHNWAHVDALIDLVESWQLGLRIMFQPARASLFGAAESRSVAWLLGRKEIARAFDRIEARKHAGAPIANRWGSLRHYRGFPRDIELPCAAGWIKATMDPSGNLYHCGMTLRPASAPNVKVLGAEAAFAALPREGCAQCWCARAVEGNQMWAGQLIKLNLPLSTRQD